MGILRIKEASVEELIDKDPYDFFSLDEPHTEARKLRPEIWAAACVGVLASFALAAAAFWSIATSRPEVDDRPFAYFEIKVIDGEGRPVTGALVRDGEKPLGVTDSFGEWRRFLKVKPGTTMAFTIAKKTTNGATLSAVKNMAVPIAVPEGGELELTGSVQLGKLSARSIAAARRKAEAADEAALALAAAPATSAPLPPPKLEFAVAGSEAIAVPVPEVAKVAKPPVTEINFDAVWVMAEQTQDARLAEVLALLKRRSRELGLRIAPDAPWRLQLRHLDAPADKDGVSAGLVLVEGAFQGGAGNERLFSYLRNYQEDMLQTARDILWSVTQHVRKAHRVYKEGERWFVRAPEAPLWQLGAGRILEDGAGKLHKVIVDPAGSGALALAPSSNDPCPRANECDLTTAGVRRLPPIGGWQRLKLKVLGPVQPDTDFYVSGYLAYKRQGGTYDYWGVPGGAANVTVVRGGKLLHRERVNAGANGTATLSLPQAPISLR